MTELTWEGKYDKDGKRVAPVRIALPFQTVETVNESGVQRAAARSLWEQGQPAEWRNRLIWGDKKYVLPSLLPEFAGKVNLIYIDPPFATGADFSFTTTIPESDDSFLKEPSMIEQKAYRDTWGKGLDSYLQWFYETIVLLCDLLITEDGSMYVHLDWNMGHYAKAVLDEVFGRDHCQNEIIWKRTSARSDSHTYNHIHDTIFLYTKGDSFRYHVQYGVYDQSYLDNFYRYVEEGTGRRFAVDNWGIVLVERGGECLEVKDIGDAEQAIEPDAEGVGREFGVEARRQPSETVGMVGFDVELEGELTVDGLDELTQMRVQLTERPLRAGDAGCRAAR